MVLNTTCGTLGGNLHRGAHDHTKCQTNDRWALSFDDAQWIVMHRWGRQWRSFVFISGDRGIMDRVCMKRGVPPPRKPKSRSTVCLRPAGLALIAALCAGFTLGLTAPAWAGFDELR